MKQEIRAVPGRITVQRRDVNGKVAITIAGHAAVYYREGKPETEFDFGFGRERIMPGAFDAALKDGQDVRALWNHDARCILGRVKPGTLRLSTDETGLAYECDLPDTQTARDLAASVERGDVDGSSFAFTIRRNADGSYAEKWEKPLDGKWVRTIGAVDLYDVSPVTFPAYGGTSASIRAVGETVDLQTTVAQLEQRAKDAEAGAQEAVRKQEAADFDLKIRMVLVGPAPLLPEDL